MVVRFLLWCIQGYQYWVSPLLGNACRYHPTCSHYMAESLRRYGVLGVLLGSYRVVRCNPLSRGGIDPVPEHFLWMTAPRTPHEP